MKKCECFTADCSHCENGIIMKRNYWGELIYTCSYYPKKHKAIDAEDCGMLECKKRGNQLLCYTCKG